MRACSSPVYRPLSCRYPPGHPLAWLEEEAAPSTLTPERRRELIELGFPDDGYDYLAHMRVVGGRGAAGRLQGPDAEEPAEAPAPGPSVFLAAPRPQAPVPDAALYDAHALVLPSGAAADDEEALRVMGGVTAFARRRQRAPGATRVELEELETVVEEAEAEGDEADDGMADGIGDLLDDFVLTAMAAPEGAESAASEEEAEDEVLVSDIESVLVESDEEEEDEEEEDEEEEEEEEEEEGDGLGELRSFGGAAGSRAPPKAGSIASTYWREERQDRRGLLTNLDEQCVGA